MKMDWTRRELMALAAAAPAAAAPKKGKKAAAQPAVPPIESAFSPRDGQWRTEWPNRIAQHDVVYLSPPEDPTLGLPIGNGDLGALLWTEGSQLIVAINKCDTWDDAAGQGFHGGAEDQTALRHCGRLTIDFGSPLFDLIYQKNFEARLELATAQASLHAVAPFGEAAVTGYASAPHHVIALRCEVKSAEKLAPQVKLERWGSRTFARWYSNVTRDASLGLGGTATRVERGRIVIEQKLHSISFAVAVQAVPDAGATALRKLHSRAGAIDLDASEKTAFTVYITAVTSENDPDPVGAVHRLLDKAVAEGEAAIRQKHQEDWRRFWSASMVDLPEKYLENIWHLTLYFANSSSRGGYPPHFCNGLWGWNHDFVPWNDYFHWNMQWYAWPLAAANHAELAVPYFRLRAKQLPQAVAHALKQFQKPGAFYADVFDRRGENSPGLNDNRTPGPQVALEFWRQYAYTGDEKFLRELAWPVIREVTRFQSSFLVEGTDGLLHTTQTSAYEGSPLFDDTITDLAMIRALLPVAIRAGKIVAHDTAELDRWDKQLAKLAPFHTVDPEDYEFEAKGEVTVHRGGLGNGKPALARKVFAVGRNKEGKWVRNRYAGRPDLSYYGIPDVELAPVFPAGVIGLAQRDSDLFRTAVTQVRLHPPAVAAQSDEKATMAGSGELCMGWCPYPIVLARLGLSEELIAELLNSVSTWQFYPQGFGHYGPYGVFRPDMEQRWRLNTPLDMTKGAKEEKFPFPAWPFRHFDNEAMPIVSCAINEMLLQSHDGVIRVCPAVPADWNVRFDLQAQGGFRISAEQAKGKLVFVAVDSRQGGPCRISHPWPGEPTLVCLDTAPGAKKVTLAEETNGSERILRWETQAGHRYVLARHKAALDTWTEAKVPAARRDKPRVMKQAILGREKLY